ncbi:hypothetical protein AB2L57_10695 [Microbacterium sp. HA-8]|uniref:hypothetical protein n=1 Tax=Microbacterium sp. HA-8 TaxID=3234200 RepID=UPI0038F7AA0B
MPDSVTPVVETPAAPEAPAAPPAPVAETPDYAAQIAALEADRDKWKGLSRKHEAAAKTPGTTDEQLAEIRAELAASKLDAIKARIAGTKGVPEAILTGTDEESLTAAADTFLAAVAAASAAATPPAPPANDAVASGANGASVAGSVKQLTRVEFAALSPAERIAAKEAGQIADLLAGR